jgi:hypothetical protein
VAISRDIKTSIDLIVELKKIKIKINLRLLNTTLSTIIEIYL